ncbi:MAG: hypothetical protein A4E63_03146 [Syntrophorhabdus sp. PtaU1.Bin050]|nr:MAG: hypothetical protein A4E63_03146 [Syntrophorhabdus sp. PtaU1.Bin050]
MVILDGAVLNENWYKSFRVRSLAPDPIKGTHVVPSTSKAVGASPSRSLT